MSFYKLKTKTIALYFHIKMDSTALYCEWDICLAPGAGWYYPIHTGGMGASVSFFYQGQMHRLCCVISVVFIIFFTSSISDSLHRLRNRWEWTEIEQILDRWHQRVGRMQHFHNCSTCWQQRAMATSHYLCFRCDTRSTHDCDEMSLYFNPSPR